MEALDKQSLQRLLDEQSKVIERAMAYHKEIAKRVADLPSDKHEAGSSRAGSKTKVANKLEVPVGQEPQPKEDSTARGALSYLLGGSNVLSVPLLGGSKNPSEAEAEGEAGESPREMQLAPSGLFNDREQLKKGISATLKGKVEYETELHYHEEGPWQAIARNDTFKNFTLFVIFLNTIWIGIDTDINDAALVIDSDWYIQLVENLFCIYFTFEIFVRYMAFKVKCDAFHDGWFVFDFTLVFFMVWETWLVTAVVALFSKGGGGAMGHMSILRALRLFRLLRASRVLRLLKHFPEMMILVQAMMAAMRSVVVTLSLTFVILYVFAILFKQLMKDEPDPASRAGYDTVLQAMSALIKNGVFPDQQDLIDQMLQAESGWVNLFGIIPFPLYYFLCLLYLGLACLTLMNLLIGVLCEVVNQVAEDEREVLLSNEIKTKIMKALPYIDADGDNSISAKEFEELINVPQAIELLNDVGVDVCALVDYADFIFLTTPEREQISLDFDEFLERVLSFRGGNKATVKDILDSRKSISREIQALERRLLEGQNQLLKQAGSTS